ncbi:MAG: hypothetical protein JWM21_337 [Acidobacteria bacterium]|nr:hypothetical protein [Acidobacteriota bacterium]
MNLISASHSKSVVPILLRFQWRAYWRRFARGRKLAVGNQGLSLIIIGIVAFKYVQALNHATVDLMRGRTSLLQSLLAGIWVAWLITTNSSREQRSIAAREWLHLPLSLREFFVLRAISLLIPPNAWLVLLGSLAICYPLAYAPHPLLGIVAAGLFISLSWFVGLAVAHLLSIAIWRRVLVAAALLLTIGMVFYLQDQGRAGMLEFSALMPLLPMGLVARTALGQQSWAAILLLAMLTLLSFGAALWSYRQSLESASPRSPAAGNHAARLRIPGRLGGMLVKDMRYFWRLLDTYLGLLASAAGCFYLVTAPAPALDIFLVFLTLIFIPIAPLAFNCFGLDTESGLDRYALFPLAGRTIMLSKNLAFLCVVLVQAGPLILLASWQVGAFAAVLGLVTFTSLACASLIWGNWMSLSHPMKLHFFRFSSSSASIFDAMAGVMFLSSPGILIIYLLHSRYSSALNLALICTMFGGLYFFSLVRSGRRFDQKRESIARALS